MRRRSHSLAALLMATLVAACASSAATLGPQDGATPPVDGGNTEAGAWFPLGMNDVTILLPLPSTPTTTVVLRGSDLADDGKVLLPRALFDRLAEDTMPVPGAPAPPPILGNDAYDRVHLVAVRFDLCDRGQPGPCGEGDGRLRLVFQPMSDLPGRGFGAEDVGLHAFYVVPAAEIPFAVSLLRELARMQGAALTTTLRPSPALTGPSTEASAYATKLRALVRRYAGEGRLVRLTLNALPETTSQVLWRLRGLEKHGATFDDMAIAGTSATTLEVRFSGGSSGAGVGYEVTPAVDTPKGLATLLSETSFSAAPAATKRDLLDVLAAIDNPLEQGADTVPCVACHVSTVLMNRRAAGVAIDPRTLVKSYTSTHDLSVSGGKSAETGLTLRALGWLDTRPMISQRVVNDTAQVLLEIERRFPQ